MNPSSFYRQIARRKTLNAETIKETKLKRVLGTLDLTLLGIGSTLGVGIYVLAGRVAKDTAGPGVIISFFIAAVASMFAGLCYAEFGARVPRAGSAYVYSYYTVGEFVAFVIGWNLILEYAIGTASVVKGLSTYIDALCDNAISTALQDAMPIHVSFLGSYPDFFAFGIVIVASCGLAFGMKESSLINNVCTGVNLLVVVIVVITGAIKADPDNWSIPVEDIPSNYTDTAGVGGFAPFGVVGIIKGAAMCFYGFIGFDAVATTGEEAKTPQKSIPIAIICSLLVVFLAYFSVSTVLTLMLPYYLQNADAPLVYVFEKLDLHGVKWTVSIGAIFGLIPSMLGSLYPLPRIIYAMATDGLLFRFLGIVSERFQSPVIGTLLAGFITGIMALLFNLEQLTDMMSIGTLIAYSIVAACVLMLRYRKSDEDEENIDKRFGQLFKMKKSGPTDYSSSAVSWLVLSFCAFCIATEAVLIFAATKLNDHSSWAIALVIIFGLVAVLSIILISLQPKSIQKLSFMVPLVPLIPVISIVINIYLMLMLDVVTWIRFGVWLLVGLLIYFSYGISHSSEKTNKKF